MRFGNEEGLHGREELLDASEDGRVSLCQNLLVTGLQVGQQLFLTAETWGNDEDII